MTHPKNRGLLLSKKKEFPKEDINRHDTIHPYVCHHGTIYIYIVCHHY